jgi:hypothetical protein
MQQISGWEQAQNSLAKATLRNGGDYFPGLGDAARSRHILIAWR